MYFFELLNQLNKLKKPISPQRLEQLYALVKEKHGVDGEALLKKVLIGLGYLNTQSQDNPLEAAVYNQVTPFEAFYNHALYEKLLPLCQLAFLSENNGLPEEHAFKLSVIFNDVPKTLGYLLEYARTLKSKDYVLHDACLFNFPTPADCEFKEWRLLAQKNLVNPRFQELFPFAPQLEEIAQTGKKRPQKKLTLNFDAITQQKKALEQANREFKNESTRFIPRTERVQLAARQEKLSQLGADIGKKRRELTKLSQGVSFAALDIVFLQAFYESYRFKLNEAGQTVLVNNGITPKDIARFEQLVGANDDNAVPNVFLDGEALGYPGIYLKKLDTLSHHGKALAASLGKITSCCQFLGGVGDSCAVHGITSPNAGFYVVCRGNSKSPSLNDPILAQSWAWRGLSQGICLDSIEQARDAKVPEREGIISLYRLLGHTLCQQFNVPRVNTGSQSGITGTIGLNDSYTNKEHFKDYAGYCDSKSQLPLANQAMPYLFYGQTSSPLFESFIVETTKAFFKGFFNTETPLKTNEDLKQAISFALQTQRNDLLDLLLEEANNSPNPFHKEECQALIEINQAYYQSLNAGKINLALIQDGACLNMFNTMGQTALHLSLDESLDSFKTLLALKPNLNIQDKHGNTALFHALEQILYNGKNEAGRVFADSLIEAGAELDIKDHDEATPLIIAVKNNDLAMVIKLHAHGADLDTFDDDMKTALFWAVQKGHMDIFNYLIKQGAKTNITSYSEGSTLLMAAAKNENIEMVKTILANPASSQYLEASDKIGKTALFIAIETGNKEIFDALATRGASFAAVSNSGENVLLAAISSQNSALAELIFAQHPELLKLADKSGDTALMRAVSLKNSSLVRFMLESPFCDLEATDNKGKTALFIAARMGNKEIFECLANKGASFAVTNVAGQNILMEAIGGQNDALVELILTTHPELLKQTNHYGQTPLMQAIACGNTPLVRTMLERYLSKTDLDLCNLNGKSALFIAAEIGNKEIFDCLAKSGASFATLSKSGENVLMAAISSRNKELAELIFAQHPELLEQVNDAGETALMQAISSNHNHLARTMLASPFCSPNVLMQRQKTPLSLNVLYHAVNMEELELVELIVNHPNTRSIELLSRTFFEITPLYLAVHNGRPDIAQVIVASPQCTTEVLLQFFPNEKGLFSKAALLGQLEVVKAILANPHCTSEVLLQNQSILFDTIRNRREITLAILKSESMSSQLFWQKDPAGNTLLAVAARMGDVELVKLICASPYCNESYLMQENDNKKSILIEAMARGHEDVVQAILASPACQNETRRQYKAYSLLQAVKNKDFAKVIELMEASGLSHQSAANYNEQTAFSIAVETGQAEIFNYLLSKGAKTNEYLMSHAINFIDTTLEKLYKLRDETTGPMLCTILIEANKFNDYLTILKDKVKSGEIIDIARTAEDLNELIKGLKSTKLHCPLLRMQWNIIKKSDEAIKAMGACHEALLKLRTPTTPKSYIMEPIVHFLITTCVKLEEKKAAPEIKNMFHLCLKEVQGYLNQPGEDIAEYLVIQKQLALLVATANDRQKTPSFFAQKNSELFQAFSKAIEEADKRSLAFSSENNLQF